MQLLSIHATHPQSRLITQVVDVLRSGGIIIYPTDSAYALGCALGNRQGIDRIRGIRDLSKRHNFTLICRDLSALSNYARVDNVIFRLLKRYTPGPYTFVMQATKEVPKRLQHPKRKTIGLRIPAHPITQAVLEPLEAPILSVSLIMPDETLPIADLEDLPDVLKKQVDLAIDGGHCGIEPTTVVDLTAMPPELIRQGRGAWDFGDG